MLQHSSQTAFRAAPIPYKIISSLTLRVIVKMNLLGVKP